MSSSTTEPQHVVVDVPMPQMGTSIVEGTVVAWNRAVGDLVELDEALCEISTDKVESECPSPAAGVLTAILVNVGETVEVGTVLARIAVDDAVTQETAKAAEDDTPAPAPSAAPQAPIAVSRPRHYSPVVQRVATAHGIDLSLVTGTGRGGRVTKRDVLAAVDGAASGEPPLHSDSPYRPDVVSAPAVVPVSVDALGGVAEPLTHMRVMIGTAMRRSLDQAATCHTVVECDMTRVEARRRELDLTALPIVARAVIDVLSDYGDLNATLDGVTVTRYERVHLGIAVSLGVDGLIVPVIHDAQEFSVEGMARRIKDLAARARAKELKPEDVRGATFTITSPGAFGAVLATPIINVPQVAILDLEAIIRRQDAQGNEAIAIRPMTNLILGWDHRALDGAYAARFLTALRRQLEH